MAADAVMEGKAPGSPSNEAERELEAALDAVDPWRGRVLSYAPVSGGISNTNWRIAVAGEPGTFFLKMPGRGTAMFIDRAAALAASRRAHALGIGPRVHEHLAGRGIEINDFMSERRPSTNRDFAHRDVRAAAVAVYRTLHGSGGDLGPLPLTKTVFDMIDEHVEQARDLAAAFPADAAWLFKQVALARAALDAAGFDLVPCFNDPMPGNFMLGDDGSMVLIDYEYASNNDRCYDLAIWCGEMFFPDAVEDEVIETYFGRFDPRMKARLILHRALADMKWATWAMVQGRVSTLDFDFHKYGTWKHMRARAVMRDPRWVEALRRV